MKDLSTLSILNLYNLNILELFKHHLSSACTNALKFVVLGLGIMEKITPWIDPADKYGAVGVRLTNTNILVLCISELRAPGNDGRKLMDWYLQFLVVVRTVPDQ